MRSSTDIIFSVFISFFWNIMQEKFLLSKNKKTKKKKKQKPESVQVHHRPLENACHKLWVIYLCHNISWRPHKLSCCHPYICKNTAEHFDMLSIFTSVFVPGQTCAWRGRWHWLPRGSHVCRPSHAWLKCGSKAVWGSRGAWDMRGGE